jgi:hypothetical protein
VEKYWHEVGNDQIPGHSTIFGFFLNKKHVGNLPLIMMTLKMIYLSFECIVIGDNRRVLSFLCLS